MHEPGHGRQWRRLSSTNGSRVRQLGGASWRSIRKDESGWSIDEGDLRRAHVKGIYECFVLLRRDVRLRSKVVHCSVG